MKIRWAPVLATTAVAGVGAYLFYRWWNADQALLSPEVEDKLPIAKDLPTITDFEANYDIDGVSYDVEGVIVSSDNSREADLTP